MTNMRLAVLSLFAFVALLNFQNCDKKSDPTPKEVTENLLKSKTWAVGSVDVPVNTATESAEWVDFTVSFGTSMTTANHPAGASAVWPSGSYTVNEAGNQITRGDGVVMTVNVTETSFRAQFTVPTGTEIDGGGRVAALEGDYTFNMQ